MGSNVAGDGSAATRAVAWQSFKEWCSGVVEWRGGSAADSVANESR